MVYAYKGVYGMFQSKVFGTFRNLVIYIIDYFLATYWFIEAYDASKDKVDGLLILVGIFFECFYIYSTVKYMNARRIESLMKGDDKDE